ncbi:glycosyltransferase [Algoriphagus sp. D3-2-R+10]|uniref:glycosyltransferase family 4 protein n=1 Tax=Algoriphagus aurantiacus TaxID=3103948 RepID=UPI002B3D9764|nr:glycosyltransferase [Algoriphagus sp. D3-2-R+10]MEB2777522.1 glycosyltransferase [Algoriphagus sp. D3-2-R+10]
MRLLIVTHVSHIYFENKYYAYGPYIREMNLWGKYFDEIIIVAPLKLNDKPSTIDLYYLNNNIRFMSISEFNFTNSSEIIRAIFISPLVIYKIFRGMIVCDHIHLRCPGNMGLLGCLIQVFFPWKKKTAKYAGNWDPKSVQPFSYKLQQKILNNSIITKNMKALVYGNWSGLSKNILPFFTASYSNSDIVVLEKSMPKTGNTLNLIFVGSLVSGKNPLIALHSLKLLVDRGYQVHLNVCGNGDQYDLLMEYIENNNLNKFVSLTGNVNAIELKNHYQKSHFLIFLSDSEGWPKVVAEAMFFGCLPLTTSVSCVPDMLGYGERGDLIHKDSKQVLESIEYYFENPEEYQLKSNKARVWSNHYTLELFQSEISKLI